MSKKRNYDKTLAERRRAESDSSKKDTRRKSKLDSIDNKMASLPNEMSILYSKQKE